MAAPGLIGVDIGGTKVATAVLRGGELSEERIVPTEKGSPEALIDQIVVSVERLRDAGALAVGVGVPSVVDFATGTAKASVNIPLAGVPLRQVLRDRLGLPVFVDNDATCAALAEAHDGDKRVHDDLVMLTVGTGVGGGLVLGGKVYRGTTGAAAELGHTIVGALLKDGAPDAAPKFPQEGSLERNAAGRALDRLAQEAAEAEPESPLGRLAASGKPVLGPDAVEAAQQGDPAALRAVRILGERLGIGIANMINTFDPEVVVIGGGASRAGRLLLDPAKSTAWKFVLTGVGEQTSIRIARYGAEAGLRGAALMAGQELVLEEGKAVS